MEALAACMEDEQGTRRLLCQLPGEAYHQMRRIEGMDRVADAYHVSVRIMHGHGIPIDIDDGCHGAFEAPGVLIGHPPRVAGAGEYVDNALHHPVSLASWQDVCNIYLLTTKGAIANIATALTAYHIHWRSNDHSI